MSRLTRRELLLAASALGLAAPAARAIGPLSKTSIGQLQHRGTWDPRPEALRRMLWETGKRTSIDVARDANAVRADSDELFMYPLLVLTGEGALPEFNERERARLQRHLRFGGLLYIDAPSPSDAFAADARREIERLLPGSRFAPLKKGHVLFKSFFLLNNVVGRTDEDTTLYGIELNGRVLALMTQCDVLGALERDRFGTWSHECEPGGERQREMAIRFAVNVLMYATCLDYKTDQVHIPFIMKKRRR